MIAIVKYNAGNIQSVLCALERLGYNAVVSDDIEVLKSADKVIFPGVGEASTAMKYLKSTNLIETLKNLKQPFLGICLGMQLMCSYSEENSTKCMNIFEQKVLRFDKSSGDKIPQVGWNNIEFKDSPLFKDLPSSPYCYFVHSYYVAKSENTIATCTYAGVEFSAALNKDNYYCCQFHPEKSGSVGEKILKNFLELEEKR